VERLLVERVEQLVARVEHGDGAAWIELVATASALAAVAAQNRPEARGQLLTTAEFAERCGVRPKTILRKKARGEIRPAVQLGTRGRAALRWRGDEVLA
jgi:hypothetical protein